MSEQKNTVWKYCYWMSAEQLEQLKEEMHRKGIEVTRAKQNPCEILLGEIGYAEPAVWPTICRYDAAPWYNGSKHAGSCLVASSKALEPPFDGLLTTTIEPVDFAPPRIPAAHEIRSLAAGAEKQLPEGWGAFPEEMGDAIVGGLEKVFGTRPASFEELLTTWTAVHANFLSPAFRSGDAFGNAPYSISDSVHISTCCVELFNLLDTQEAAMLVRPCIGGVIVKGLERDRYYLVKPARGGSPGGGSSGTVQL